MNLLRFVLIFPFLVIFNSEVNAGWEDYKKKTLEATINENKDILGTTDFNFTPGLPQLVLAKYTKEIRNTPRDHEAVIKGWVKTIGQNPRVSDRFLQQMKFEENDKTYWLAIQHALIPHVKKELKKGDYVWLYVAWVGTTKTDWVFVVNEFEKAERK